MAEILVKFDEPIQAASGDVYFAQAAGREREDGMWESWIEFLPTSELTQALESGRETTQPNRTNAEYWAKGLTKVYLEGALNRALDLVAGPRVPLSVDVEPSRFTSPAPHDLPPSTVPRPSEPRPVLDPFEVYSQGEGVLRRELSALSRDHIERIASGYAIAGFRSPADTTPFTTSELIQSIIEAARLNQARSRRPYDEPRAPI